jgi:hypothetical protein
VGTIRSSNQPFSRNGVFGLRAEVADNAGGLNGSMQHYLIWRWC